MMLNANKFRVEKFVQLFKLLPDEIKLFEDKFKNCLRIIKAIDYHQKGQLDVYSKKLVRR